MSRTRILVAATGIAAFAFAAGSLLGVKIAGAQTTAGGTIRGIVYDSLAGAPIVGARVALLDRSDAVRARTVKTDGDGRYEFGGLAPGVYLVGFQSAIFDSLGLASPTRAVQIAASGTGALNVDLAVPSARTIHDVFCPGRPASDSTSVWIGHLTDASTRGVISGGTVQASWIGVARGGRNVAVHRVTAEATSGNDGWFAICDLPGGRAVDAVAAAGPDTSNVVQLHAPDRRGLIRQELYLTSASAPHAASVEGLVKDAITLLPVANAHVIIDEVSTRTGPDGRFALHGLAYGTTMMTVSQMGYETDQRPVSVLAGAPTDVAVSLLTQGAMADSERGIVARSIADQHGFTARKKTLEARFLLYGDLQRMNSRQTSDVVMRTLGLHSVDTASTVGFTSIQSGYRQLCSPTFYIDGVVAKNIRNAFTLDNQVPLKGIAAMELYDGDGPRGFPRAPYEYSNSTCDTVLIWMLPAGMWPDSQ